MANNFEAQIGIAYQFTEADRKMQQHIKRIQSEYKVKFGVDLDTKTATKAAKQFSEEYQKALGQNKINMDNRLESYLKNNSRLSSDLKNKINEIRVSLGKIDDNSGLKSLQNDFRNLKSEAESLNQTGKNSFDKLKDNTKNFLNFLASGTLIMSGVNA
jgi:predicted  nucleic acid-binding Zn-ribbon protein